MKNGIIIKLSLILPLLTLSACRWNDHNRGGETVVSDSSVSSPSDSSGTKGETKPIDETPPKEAEKPVEVIEIKDGAPDATLVDLPTGHKAYATQLKLPAETITAEWNKIVDLELQDVTKSDENLFLFIRFVYSLDRDLQETVKYTDEYLTLGYEYLHSNEYKKFSVVANVLQGNAAYAQGRLLIAARAYRLRVAPLAYVPATPEFASTHKAFNDLQTLFVNKSSGMFAYGTIMAGPEGGLTINDDRLILEGHLRNLFQNIAMAYLRQEVDPVTNVTVERPRLFALMQLDTNRGKGGETIFPIENVGVATFNHKSFSWFFGMERLEEVYFATPPSKTL